MIITWTEERTGKKANFPMTVGYGKGVAGDPNYLLSNITQWGTQRHCKEGQ